MGISRYDIPSEQHVQSSYIGLPLSELSMAAQNEQSRADKNLGDLNSESILLNKVPHDERHNERLHELVSGFQKEATDLSGSGLDPASPEFTKRKSALINKYANNPEFAIMGQEVESQNAREKAKIEAMGSEQGYLPENDPHHDIEQQYQLYRQGKAPNPYIHPETGQAVTHDFQGIHQASDSDKFFHDNYSKVQEDAVKSGLLTKDEMGRFHTTEGKEGVYMNKLLAPIFHPKKDNKGNEVYDNLGNPIVDPTKPKAEYIDRFIASPSGKQFLRTFKRHNPNATQQEVVTAILDKGINIAQEYTSNKRESDITYTHDPKHALDKRLGINEYASPEKSQQHNYFSMLGQNNQNIKPNTYDEAINSSLSSVSNADPEMVKAAAGGGGFVLDFSKKTGEGGLMTLINSKDSQGQSKYPGLDKIAEDNYGKGWKEQLQKNSKLPLAERKFEEEKLFNTWQQKQQYKADKFYTFNDFDYDSGEDQAVKRKYIGDKDALGLISTKNIRVLNPNGSLGSVIPGSTFIKEYAGGKPSEFISGTAPLGKMNPNPDFVAGLPFSFTKSNGETVQFVMEGSSNQNANFNHPLHEMSKVMMDGGSKEVVLPANTFGTSPIKVKVVGQDDYDRNEWGANDTEKNKIVGYKGNSSVVDFGKPMTFKYQGKILNFEDGKVPAEFVYNVVSEKNPYTNLTRQQKLTNTGNTAKPTNTTELE